MHDVRSLDWLGSPRHSPIRWRTGLSWEECTREGERRRYHLDVPKQHAQNIKMLRYMIGNFEYASFPGVSLGTECGSIAVQLY
eukprot:15452516-Heterocapsa_arctica.AAC.1